MRRRFVIGIHCPDLRLGLTPSVVPEIAPILVESYGPSLRPSTDSAGVDLLGKGGGGVWDSAQGDVAGGELVPTSANVRSPFRRATTSSFWGRRNVVPMASQPLSNSQLDEFVERGWTLLRGAFCTALVIGIVEGEAAGVEAAGWGANRSRSAMTTARVDRIAGAWSAPEAPG
jgi:hypothetical protein